MGQYIVLGSMIIVTLALITDAGGTVHLITMIITVKGISFIVKKIVDSFNRDSGQMVNFVGNCVAGISAIGLIKNAIKGVKPVSDVLGKVGEFVMSLGSTVDGLKEFINGISFWN